MDWELSLKNNFFSALQKKQFIISSLIRNLFFIRAHYCQGL